MGRQGLTMEQARLLAAISGMAALSVFLSYLVQRVDFQTYITSYTAMFALYIWLVWGKKTPIAQLETAKIFWLGIGLRGLLLFSIPNLSEDYARFLWDGRLIINGIHPFSHPPDYFAAQGFWPELYAKLNSPHYFSVYPPLCQAVFALAALLQSEWAGVIVLKLTLLGCEAGTMRLLLNGRLAAYIPKEQSLKRVGAAYALNPLILLEIAGNAHFEGAMIFLVLAGLAAFEKQQNTRAALFWAMATAIKLLPLLFLPLLWRRMGGLKGFRWMLWYGIFCLLLFAPLIPVIPHMLQSVNLYFQKFQFNASFYYLVRFLGFRMYGWDVGLSSGPGLGLLSMALILIIAWRNPPKTSLPQAMMFTLMVYFSFAAVVHPWYVAFPLALSLLGSWRFVVFWSGLAGLSYSHYQGGAFQENYLLIGLEYGLLWTMILMESSRRFLSGRLLNSS